MCLRKLNWLINDSAYYMKSISVAPYLSVLSDHPNCSGSVGFKKNKNKNKQINSSGIISGNPHSSKSFF